MSIQNFLIVGTQRTGSTAIGEMMGRHPDVVCGWEWTQRGNWFRKIQIAEDSLATNFAVLDPRSRANIEERYTGEQRWLGFRRLFRSSNKWIFHPALAPSLWMDRLESHLKWFRKRQDIRFIHIVRRNNLEWIKSKELSRITQAYLKHEYPKDLQVPISVSEAVARLRSKNWVDGKLGTLADTNHYLRVNYEDFANDGMRETRRILEFLDCDLDLLPSGRGILKPQSRGSASNYISNFEELHAELSSKGLEESCV